MWHPEWVIFNFYLNFVNISFLVTLFLLLGFPKIVDMLIQRGANVNAVDVNLNTPLHLAEENIRNIDEATSFAIAELLVKGGADVNAKNEDNKTPLDLAENDKSKEKRHLKR